MLIIVVLSVCLGDAPFFRNIRIFQNLPFFGTFTENDVAPANLYRFWWNFVCSFGYGWVYPPANFIKKSWSVLEIQLHMWTSWVFDMVTFFTYTALSPAKVERSKRFFIWNCVYIYPTSVPSFSKKKYQQGSVLGINTKHSMYKILTPLKEEYKIWMPVNCRFSTDHECIHAHQIFCFRNRETNSRNEFTIIENL